MIFASTFFIILFFLFILSSPRILGCVHDDKLVIRVLCGAPFSHKFSFALVLFALGYFVCADYDFCRHFISFQIGFSFAISCHRLLIVNETLAGCQNVSPKWSTSLKGWKANRLPQPKHSSSAQKSLKLRRHKSYRTWIKDIIKLGETYSFHLAQCFRSFVWKIRSIILVGGNVWKKSWNGE